MVNGEWGMHATNRPSYMALIKQAFNNQWWDSNKPITYTTADSNIGSMDQFDPPIFSKRIINKKLSLMESNFSLIFGLAIQMYESTLVADDTPVDRYMRGDLTALTANQLKGKKLFEIKGKCLNCHSGPEFTNASFANVNNERIETMLMGDEFLATYDNGFYNIGVRPTADDLGVGGTDPFGRPLSETRMVKMGLEHLLGNNFDPTRNPTAASINRIAVDGAFKTPGLRNVELTGPYFHQGGKSTLMQVVDFYNRGGDFHKKNEDNADPDIQRLHFTDQEKEDLVSFLIGLTDERVRLKRAPFDHPSLCVTNGQKGNEDTLFQDGNSIRSVDDMKCIQAVGKAGVKKQFALKPFLQVDHFLGDEFKKKDVASVKE
jgi:cytochrome c peroxidase